MCMKETSANHPTDKFPFKFSTMMLFVLILLLLLCAGGFGLTLWQFLGFLKGEISSVWEWLKYILMFLVCGLLFVLVVSMFIKSQYIITDKELILQFGFIKTRYELKKIRSVRHFMGSGRLAVYFDDMKNQYTIIVVKESWFKAFAEALKAKNEDIEFDFITPAEEEEWKKKK